jgi:nucleotide-binding universal stress UspA family protein
MDSVVPTQEELPIVAGVDGSRNGRATVDLAAVEAVRRRCPLLIVHVWPGRYLSAYRGRGVLSTHGDAERLLDVSLSRAGVAAPGVRVDGRVVDGGAANVLTRFSERARLLVVGHRDDVAARPSWGSTAAYLAHHSACPLLVQRGSAPDQGPVVVAASTRASGVATLDAAFAEAVLLGTKLVAVHVWTGEDGDDGAAAEERLTTALNGYSERFPQVRIDRLVIRDLDVAYTVERASQRGRLLVVGMGANGRFAELLYGSRGPVRHTACPVLLVPPGWHAPGEAVPGSKPGSASW